MSEPILQPTQQVHGTKVFQHSRVYEAPRELVFKAWTDPDCLSKWWGPKGMQWIGCTMDLRPGGTFLYGLKAPNGFEMWGKFVYREVTVPERLVYVVSFCDKNGAILRHPLSETWPLEVLSTLAFTEQDGKTITDSTGIPINATKEECETFEGGFDSMRKGFTGTLDQLAEFLSRS
ncbi:MAG: SRPBCC domain-containing protein [Candidatus Hydrogenedentes bacterium]|nr:SRPBCC domain-containing protein [Candidatus Hydrogenedentota bacterium]